MDDFAVDLDKVLDDFELSEGGDVDGNAPQLLKTPAPSLNVTNEHALLTQPADGLYTDRPLASNHTFILESEPLDLSGADFAPSPPPSKHILGDLKSLQHNIDDEAALPPSMLMNIKQNGHHPDSLVHPDTGLATVDCDLHASCENHGTEDCTEHQMSVETKQELTHSSDTVPSSLLRKKDVHSCPPTNSPLFGSNFPGPNNGALDMMHLLNHQKSPRDSGISVSSEMPSLPVANEEVDIVPSPTSSMESPQHLAESPSSEANPHDYISDKSLGNSQQMMKDSNACMPATDTIVHTANNQQQQPVLSQSEAPASLTESLAKCSDSQNSNEPVYNGVLDIGKSSKLDLMLSSQQNSELIMHDSSSDEQKPAELVGTAGLRPEEPSGEDKCDMPSGVYSDVAPVAVSADVSQPMEASKETSMKPVGFDCIDDDDVDMDEMDAYLAQMEQDSLSTVNDEQKLAAGMMATSPSLAVEIGHVEQEQSKTDELKVSEQDSASESVASSNVSSPGRAYHTSTSGSERRSSGGSVEKFLAPALVARGITTPMDDPGFTKVPGYAPEAGMPHLPEDDDAFEDDAFEVGETGQMDAGEMQAGNEETESVEVNAAFHVDNVKEESSQAANSAGCDLQDAVVSDLVAEERRGSESVAVQDQLHLAGIVTVIPKSTAVDQEAADCGAAAEGLPPVAPAAASASLPSSDISTSLSDEKVPSDGAVSGLDLPASDNTLIPSNVTPSEAPSLAKSPTGIGARPKEPTHIKRNRPSSLLGLSKPDLKLAVPAGNGSNMDMNTEGSQSGFPSNDVHMMDPTQSRVHHGLSLDLNPNLDLHTPVPAPVFPAEPVIPHEPPPTLNHKRPGSLNLASPGQSLDFPASSDNSEKQVSAEAVDEQSEPQPKQKRPTSLNFAPRRQLPVTLDSSDSPMEGTHLNTAAGSTPYLLQAGEAAHQMGSSLEAGPGPLSPPMSCANMNNLTITQLGKVAPQWVPDNEAPTCMQCDSKFTFTKRRHHCRACGKVFCSTCCNLKCKLEYMVKEARVCSKCYQDIVRAQAYERLGSSIPDGTPVGGDSPARVSPNPNNPAEYCSTIPPLQQAADLLNTPPPTVMVPVGVLRKQGSQRSREPKQVMFSDGIRPGGDLTELDAPSVPRLPLRKSGRTAKRVEQASTQAAQQQPAPGDGSKPASKKRVVKSAEMSGTLCLIPEVGLPPILPSVDCTIEQTIEDEAEQEIMLTKISNTEDLTPVVFAINKNLFVLVKLVDLECCVNRTCWCFTTKGMCTVGQDEVVIVLECLPDESSIPRDIFCHLHSVYEQASKGNTVSHLGHTIFGQSFLGSKEHCGFLYIRPTFQCLQKLLLPQAPYVFGILLQRWETPWAKVFPIRLMLRLGAEYRYYPCPLVSVRFRKPVFGEIGHTIMNLLADFRNFQYMLPQIRGVTIHMQDKQTFVSFPRNRYEDVMKVVGSSNEHVMALGANFSMLADSHLVCIQNDDGNYHTQAINIQNKPRKITGASFVVFNGALKSSSGLRAKSSIVEDGLMVQITPEAMVTLKTAMHEMRDFTIGCGSIDTSHADEQVHVQWTEDDHQVNIGVRSPIDNMVMDGVESLHIHHATDYVGTTRTIRWTEVFFITTEDGNVSSSRCEPVDLSRLAETLAQACCMALVPQLDMLKEAGLTRIGLRINISSESVGYEIGANCAKLPDFYMNDLDNELIPVIHNAASQSQEGPVSLELIFHIIE